MARNNSTSINQDYNQSQYLIRIAKTLDGNDVIPVAHLPNWYLNPAYEKVLNVISKIKKKREDLPLSHRSWIAQLDDGKLGAETITFIDNLLSQMNIKPRLTDKSIIEAGWQDYKMIMDDNLKLGDRLMFIFDFSDKFDSGCGGDMILTKDGESSRLEPSPNSLTIVRAREGCQLCIGYLNHYSRNLKRRLAVISIILQYPI